MARVLSRDVGCMEMLKNLSREQILEVLSQGLCEHCEGLLKARARRFGKRQLGDISVLGDDKRTGREDFGKTSNSKTNSRSKNTSESVSNHRRDAFDSNAPNMLVDMKKLSSKYLKPEIRPDDRFNGTSLRIDDELSEEQERIRFAQVSRKKDFAHTEKIDGKRVNVLQGLELHTEVFNSIEQRKIVDYIFMLQREGQNGQLRARTYSEPIKWMRGKGRVTIQFGCCYNYAVDKYGNPPGIIRDEEVDPLPHLFKQMIKRMVRWQVLPEKCVPDSCIVNIYEKGDCIPPHIDHHDFVRPFCTVSFLSECNILFGANLQVTGPGEFDGPVSISLPVGSVLIFNGNGADVAKHCIPGVASQRISITFRKMHPSKLPHTHVLDRDLMGIKPLLFSPLMKSSINQEPYQYKEAASAKSSIDFERYEHERETDDEFPTSAVIKKKPYYKYNDEFTPLYGLDHENQPRKKKTSSLAKKSANHRYGGHMQKDNARFSQRRFEM